MTDALKGPAVENGFAEKVESRSETVDDASPIPRQTCMQKTGAHFKRFWWLHLAIFCACTLIIVLCLVYVAMPRIAQSGVNDTSLSFYDLQFLEPAPDSVHLTQIARLHSPSMYTPTLDPFTVGLWLVTNGLFGPTAFASIQLPSIHALHPDSNITTINQKLPVLDMDQISDYATQVLSNENVTTALVGQTKLHIGRLPVVTINYNSSSTYKSLNGLKGFNTTDLRIQSSAKTGEPNLVGNAFIPNPSVMTIDLGNVTLELSTVQHGVVGMATINNLKLVPGDNNFPLTAIVDQLNVVDSRDTATGMVTLGVIGNSSVYNGQHIEYYEKALSSNHLSLDLNITQVVLDSASDS